MSEKLQKFLATQGMGSRRQIESYIREGRITVNREPAHIGQRITGDETILFDGKELVPTHQSDTLLLIYHKPLGRICARFDPEGRPTVFEELPPCPQGRWVMVGRLDINTSGLLLFTNDGEFANQLMHPSSELPRVYRARVLGDITREQEEMLTTGVELEDGVSRFEHLRAQKRDGANKWYEVSLKRGRNREVRRLFDALYLKVNRLFRISYANIMLPDDLMPGQSVYASNKAIEQLKSLLSKK